MAQRGAAGWLQQPPAGEARENSLTAAASGEGSAILAGKDPSSGAQRGGATAANGCRNSTGASSGGSNSGISGALDRRRKRRIDSTARDQLSGLLTRHGVAAGKYACGGTLDPEEWPCLPRIKQRSMCASLTLPLGPREAEKLKAAQIKAGQGLDLNEDGKPETRLPWAIRPEADFKIVNHKIWTTKVVAPVVRKVQEALGCEEWNVEASLSEMLLCEEGCFYSEGKESDESPGVFATLIVQLPSNVEGGVFTVSDPSASPVAPIAENAFTRDGTTMVFSGPAMYYAAFYTDCERELSQVTSGRLLALVYNLRRAESTRKVSEKSGRGGGTAQPWDAGDVAMTKREAQDWEREWASFSAPVVEPNGVGTTQSTTPGKDEQPAWVTDAYRRKRAVFANFEEVPQPAEAQHIRGIVDAVRQWSVYNFNTVCPPKAAHAPPKLVLVLSHLYPDCPAGLSELKGRDRAVCNLLRLAREAAVRDVYVGRAGVDEAMLDVFLTRLVVSNGGESKGVFTTGPLVPLEPGDKPPQLRLAGKHAGAPASMFRGMLCLPRDALPVDVGSQILHSGGDVVLRDLEGDLDKIFFKGPEALEFLGKKVSQSFRCGDSRTESQPAGSIGAGAALTRFYTRAAIVFWPRAKRESVQMEATSGVHGVHARVRQLLSSLEDMLRSSASASGWAQSEDARAMKASIVTLMRQSQRLIDDEGDVDVMFECLHRCEDADVARQAVDALCDAYQTPKYSPNASPSSHSSCACMTAGESAGDVPIKMDIDAPEQESQQQASSSPTVSMLSATGLYSRVFSLCDGLRCWRTMSSQLRRLISLNPSAFAGAVIARVAIAGAEDTRGSRGNDMVSTMTSTASSRDSFIGSSSTNPWVEAARTEARRLTASSTSISQLSSPSGTDLGNHSTAAPDRGGGGGSGSGGSPRIVSPRVGGGLTRDSWQVVVGETLAGAMPDVARGEMRGVERCCSVADVRGSACSPSPEMSCDAAYSPLPLITRALQDVVGGLYAARMIRESFGWIVRGEGDLAETEHSTLDERERRLDQLGCLLWNVGDLRRSLPWHDKEEGISVKTRDASSRAEGGSGAGAGSRAGAPGGDGEGVDAAVPNGKPPAAENRNGGKGTVSFVRLVVEELQVQLVRVLDAAASVSVPGSPYPSFQMDAGYSCEHAGWRSPDDREAGMGCVTCEEVVKPFLSNPYACCISWVPWAGTDGEEFSPAFFQRLGLTFSVEGDDIKAIILTKSKGSPEIHNAMEAVRDTVYLRDRAVDILTSANTLAWLLYEREEGGRPSGGVGDRGGDGSGGGGGDGGSGPGGGAGGSGGGSPRNLIISSNCSFTPRSGGGISGAAGLTGSEIDFVVGNHDDLEYAAIYHEDGTASVCSEDWANLVEGNERRDSILKDCPRAWGSPRASASATNDSDSLKRLLLGGGENAGGASSVNGEAITLGERGGGVENRQKEEHIGLEGLPSSQGNGASLSHANGRSLSSRRWPERMDPAAVEKRIWEDRGSGMTSKTSEAPRSSTAGTQLAVTKQEGVEHASLQQQRQSPAAQDLQSGKEKVRNVATSQCAESKGETTSPAQAAAVAVAEAVAAGMSAVNLEAIGAMDW